MDSKSRKEEKKYFLIQIEERPQGTINETRYIAKDE